MQRRHLFIRLSQTPIALGTPPALAGAQLRSYPIPLLHLQDCRIAGSHHYGCATVLPQLRSSDPLRLRTTMPESRHSTAKSASNPFQDWLTT